MNVDQIYQLQRDDAFAEQFNANEYKTFVAMPFKRTNAYDADKIKNLLCNDVHIRANTLLAASPTGRTFAPLERVDGGTAAIVITDEIIRRILYSHFFFGDLSEDNFGVVLETGIGLALKPNARVLLFRQGSLSSLHFDIKVTHINRYTESDLVENTAKALVGLAQTFEGEADRYIRFVSQSLTPDAHALLNIYGILWKGYILGSNEPALHENLSSKFSYRSFQGDYGSIAFHNAARELLGKRLLWSGYNAGVKDPSTGQILGDMYGMHATRLGWKVIETVWKHDPDMRQSPHAPTSM